MRSSTSTPTFVKHFVKRRASDAVSHDLLLYRVSNLKIDLNLQTWIKGFLYNRSRFVYAKSAYSSFILVLPGASRSSVLGPHLFVIYINDLPLSVTSHTKLFAGDCAIYRSISSPSDIVALQDDLHALSSWCRT